MAQAKQEKMNQAMRDFIYFQNMIPGKHDAPFIQQFKQECLDSEENEDVKQYRQQLLNNFPPILTFKNKKQEEDFYNRQAMDCEFCCGEMAMQQANPSMKDSYRFSMGTGELYQGNSEDIKSQLKEDINSQTFGSPKQETYIKGLNEFSAKISQREPPSFSSEQQENADQSKNAASTPFNTKPKPWKE